LVKNPKVSAKSELIVNLKLARHSAASLSWYSSNFLWAYLPRTTAPKLTTKPTTTQHDKCSYKYKCYYYYIHLTARTPWVSRHQKGKPFWILLEQVMIGWQWHQLDYMEIICTSLQSDNHNSTSPLTFYRLNALPATQPTASKHWSQYKLECRPMPNVTATLPNIGGTFCSTPHSLANAHYQSAMQ